MRIDFLFATLASYCIAAQAEQACDNKSIVASTPTERFVIKEDDVHDTQTGLIWQRCVAGQTGPDCKGEPKSFDWQQALTFAAGQGKGWRLPNIRELASIVELQCGNPAINLAVFANQPAAHLWSSSPYRFYDHYAWYLDLEDGVYIYGDRQDKKHIRLVREQTPH